MPQGVIPQPLHQVNFLKVEIPTPRPYIFIISVTRQIKCLIAQELGAHIPPLPEVNFLMDEIPTPKPYIFMITRPNDFDLQLGCCISDTFSIFKIHNYTKKTMHFRIDSNAFVRG